MAESSIASGAMQTIEYQENAKFYQGATGPFYVDTDSRGNPKLNFSYGDNLTDQGAAGIGTLQAMGIPPAAIDYLNQNGTTGATKATADYLNTLVSGQSWQGTAD